MTPKFNEDLNIQDIEVLKYPNNSYKMHLTKCRIGQQEDNLLIMEQAIFKLLNTEKYKYPIYSASYGAELQELIGMPADYVRIDLKRRIEESLMQDDRIISITDFDVKMIAKNRIEAIFTVNTDFGSIKTNQEVQF